VRIVRPTTTLTTHYSHYSLLLPVLSLLSLSSAHTAYSLPTLLPVVQARLLADPDSSIDATSSGGLMKALSRVLAQSAHAGVIAM
jgi:hypothetical protein